MSARPNLTIFADASLCHRTGAAGWGAWWKGDDMDKAEEAGGGLKMVHRSSSDAEGHALANALIVAERRGRLKPGLVVMLQSDSIDCLCGVRFATGAEDQKAKGGLPVGTRKKIKSALMKQAMDAIKAVADRNQITLLVRHVRGHQEGGGRNYVNRRCDELAKAGMRNRRAQILAEKAAAE